MSVIHFQYRHKPQLGFLDCQGELVVDNFAGGGGASTGIEQAIGRSVDIAINHDPEAIELHKLNHPQTEHYCESVWNIDPREVCKGRPVGLAWFSPDCKHFSRAKGGKPVEKNIRGLAWVVLKWVGTVRPRVVCLENVEEFTTWGPIVNGQPCPKRKGKTFQSFVRALERNGYKVEWRQLRAHEYGAPTIRKRLFMVARCDGQPIIWPAPTHGDPRKPDFKKTKLQAWKTAAEIIDWSIPCPSIFDRPKPLAEATMRRIAKGIERFVINNPEPFIIPIAHYNGSTPVHDIITPLRTVTANPKGGAFAIVAPSIIKVNHGYNYLRGQQVSGPLQTVTSTNGYALAVPVLTRQFGNSGANNVTTPAGTTTAGGGGKTQLVAAFLAKHYSGVTGASLNVRTVTTVDHHSLVTSHLIKLRGTCAHGQATDAPAATITAAGCHLGEVRAFLMKYYSEGGQWSVLDEPLHTVPTKDRIGLVMVHGEAYQIVDIGMRMLQPHELYAAQGFPADYIYDRLPDGSKLSKVAQVRMCGNSVCPPVAAAIVSANYQEQFNLQNAVTI
ncbi:Site-specific DNA methylase [Hahella chejuensis KCTC 2396]|uniref:DNA (cytosine-5-)-methyltransferase n=1 Tax=Hahella chejuensis (strain KCTC 2396) TaxID=349521 RepID=Q2SI92_HAHCH|nr:DNA cytosine methyltransferase [Hahella chejuensis]ABC29632.1 Site-specific DNA methylase [Hahella chejuensis KCTC 2396]